MTAGEIRGINKALGGTAELTGNAETVISNMAYREGAGAQANPPNLSLIPCMRPKDEA